MSNTLEALRHKIGGAEQLESVVRTMKAQAASNIGQYELATNALKDYYRTVELGLIACFRQSAPVAGAPSGKKEEDVAAVVFGSDQGLVGQFNDRLTDYVHAQLDPLPGKKIIWAIGERICGHLNDAGFTVKKTLTVPGSVTSIEPLIGQILAESIPTRGQGNAMPLVIFYNRRQSGSMYEPVRQQLLPLDAAWQKTLTQGTWPTGNLPEVIGDTATTLYALLREYLFISLFRACAESLASENSSRLAAMQRAGKNIDEMLESLKQTSRTLRQSSIDEELFDVIAGYVLLAKAT